MARADKAALLAQFSVGELLEEVARRHEEGASEDEASEDEDAPGEFCEDCLYFKAYTGRGDVPAKYNPCEHGHKMAFHMPDDEGNPYGDFGFYRTICTDREYP